MGIYPNTDPEFYDLLRVIEIVYLIWRIHMAM